jgi:CoA:oxalate CoA-transferase
LAATPEAVVTAGDQRLIGSPIKISGFEPEYRAAPALDEYSSGQSS